MNASNIKQQSKIVEMYNPLINAAKPIFALTNAMKKTTSSLSTEQQLHKFAEMVDEFEETAESNGATYDSIKAAKYCLCTFIDEMAVRAGWSNDAWSKNSLLVSCFDETWGGERFFDILENAKKDEEKNLYLIEFIYLCMQFGYKGKYQIYDKTGVELTQEKKLLANVIEKNRPNLFETLFIQPAEEKLAIKRKASIPIWVMLVLLGLLMGLIYLMFLWSLGKKFDVVTTEINSITIPKVEANFEGQVASTQLEPLLKNEIDKNYIFVKDAADKSIITIRGDGLFESGSEVIQNRYFPILARVGQALNNTQGQIVVSGYTDNTPIQSLDYPSNWQLSQARADSVKKMFIDKGYIKDSTRLRSEGMGETNPVVTNDTPENKAKNRRVEIILYHLSVSSSKNQTSKDEDVMTADGVSDDLVIVDMEAANGAEDENQPIANVDNEPRTESPENQ